MPPRGYTVTPKKKRREAPAPKKVVRKLTQPQAKALKKLETATGQTIGRRVLTPKEKAAVKRDVKNSERNGVRADPLPELAGAAAKLAVDRVVGRKSASGLLSNARRNLRDIVTGAPASALALVKAGGEEAINKAGGIAQKDKTKRQKLPGMKPLKEGIKRDDPLYALGEAGVKKLQGDDKGAAKALKRAGDKAYERPVDAASYGALGAGVAGRGVTAARYAEKGGTKAARARPPKRVEGEGKSTPQKVRVQREAAQAEVRVRGGKGTVADKQLVAKVVRKPAVRKEQSYSGNAVTRTVQKGREDRKAKKGIDPFLATGKKAERIRKKRFDETSRNTHAGGLHREGRADQEGARTRKRLKTVPKIAAAQLIANDRVRRGSGAEDLEKLKVTAARRGSKNVEVLDKITPEILNDPKVQEVAAQMRAGLQESEARLKLERFFEGRDGAGVNPEFVARLQAYLARGEVVQRTKGDLPRQRVKESPPPPAKPPDEPAAPKPTSKVEPEAKVEPKAEPGPEPTTTPNAKEIDRIIQLGVKEKAEPVPKPGAAGRQAARRKAIRKLREKDAEWVAAQGKVGEDVTQGLRRAAVRTLRRKIRETDGKIAAIGMTERQAPVEKHGFDETPEQAAVRAIKGDAGEIGNPSGKTSGQDARKTRVDVKTGSRPEGADAVKLKELYEARGYMRRAQERMLAAGQIPQARELRRRLDGLDAEIETVRSKTTDGRTRTRGTVRRNVPTDNPSGPARVQSRTAAPGGRPRSERAQLQALREERKQLADKLEATIIAGKAHAAKREKAPDTSGKIVPGRGTGSIKKKDGKGQPIRLTNDQVDNLAEQGRREQIHAEDPTKFRRQSTLQAGSARTGRGTVAKDNQDADNGQGSQDAPAGVVEQPGPDAVHGAAASQTPTGSRKRTGVRVEADGYYWASGPKAGQRVVEADLEGEQGAFIRGLEHKADPSTDLRQPRAGRGYSAEDAILGDLRTDRVLATRLDRERQITLIRLARSVEESFAHKTASGQTRFTHERAQQLAAGMDGKWRTLKVDAKESVIVRREIADRWTRQIGRPSRTERAGRYVTRQFIRTVLPFSATWQSGNVVDLYTRLVATDARFAVPGLAGSSGRDLLGAVEDAMRSLDPHLADELTQSLKGHFGARSTVAPLKFSEITDDAKSQLVRAAGEWVSSRRDLPVVKPLANAGRATTDKAFAVGTKAEAAMVRRAAGSAMERYAKALGYDISDHAALAQKLAGEFKNDPAKLMEFQRRTLEITGDYVTRGPNLKLAQHTTVPFIQWIKAANKFVFQTLPVKHPYKTAFMLWAGSITEEQRRELGLSGYITPEEASKLKLKQPQTGYLAGAPRLPNGQSVPVSPLTSFGEAARIIEGIGNLIEGDNPLRDSARLTEPLVPFVQTPARVAEKQGGEVGASRAIEAFVPGAKQQRRAREGERPHPRSTIWEPNGTGGTSITDRILAGMTAPVGRAFPDERPKPGSSENQPKIGERFPVETTGPGGKKRTLWFTRTR